MSGARGTRSKWPRPGLGRRLRVAGAACCAALLLGACGSGERRFDAEGFVAELNGAGAGLELGEPLESGAADAEVRVVGFESAGRRSSQQSSGAVVVLEDAEAARTEFERCESAISFVCFRAANVVLRFAGISAVEQRRLSAALTELQTIEPDA